MMRPAERTAGETRMRLKGWSGGKHAARASRQEMSPPDLRLWLELRKEPGGHYCRR